MRKGAHILTSAVLIFFAFCLSSGLVYSEEKPDLKFEISFSDNVHPEAITGRAYLIISDNLNREPRLQRFPINSIMRGKNVYALHSGKTVTIDDKVFGFPINRLQDLPPGEYNVQGFINIYTEFKRSDGHTVWLHNDQWEGQHWNRSPGNLYSEPQKIKIDSGTRKTVRLICDKVIPPVKIPPDTKFVKRIKFKSGMLSKFWGQPIYLGATVLLPKGYDTHPDVRYPVNYIQGHFSLRAPNGFTSEISKSKNPWMRRSAAFSKFWLSDSCPRMILVTFQHPCPYYDDSYAVNSPNVGPYQDAIMQELIPEVEKRFRIIKQPYARILSGGSTGGWISLMLQVYQPDFFGGVFSLCPDPVDFNYFQCVNIYEDENAYYKKFGWLKVPTASDRSTDGIVRYTYKQRNYAELILGTRNRSGDQIDIFEAAFGPMGRDGYVKPLFDKITGKIDPQVANYWREHYDIRYHLEKNWPQIGAKLVGKLHIYVGDMDTYYLNNAVTLLEDFLEKTTDPYYAGTVKYGDGRPHCWGPFGVEAIKLMAEQVIKNAPPGTNTEKWNH